MSDYLNRELPKIKKHIDDMKSYIVVDLVYDCDSGYRGIIRKTDRFFGYMYDNATRTTDIINHIRALCPDVASIAQIITYDNRFLDSPIGVFTNPGCGRVHETWDD